MYSVTHKQKASNYKFKIIYSENLQNLYQTGISPWKLHAVALDIKDGAENRDLYTGV